MGRSTCNYFIGLNTDLLSISNTNAKADSINVAVLNKSLVYCISTSYKDKVYYGLHLPSSSSTTIVTTFPCGKEIKQSVV